MRPEAGAAGEGEVSGTALLDIAEATLRSDILPCVPPERRAAALMVGRAIRIVAREMVQWDRLEATVDALPEGPVELTGAIRAGACDADPDLHSRLWILAAMATSITRPGLLARSEQSIACLPDAANEG